MNISNEFKLNSSFIKTKTKKNQIVIGNTYNYGMNHIKSGWRNGGIFNKCPHFSIDVDGAVYQHFSTQYYSLYLDCSTDEQVISIALSNIGQLFEKEGHFYDIYNNSFTGEVFEKKWKNCTHWQPYTQKQFDATIELCRYLFNEMNISNQTPETNVCIPDIIQLEGVCYRSNHHMKHYDVNPSWDVKQFKKTIENG